MKAAVQMQKEGGWDSTVVVFDVIPDIPDSTLMFDVIPGKALVFDVIPDSKLVFDVISNNIAVVDEAISEKCHFSEISILLHSCYFT